MKFGEALEALRKDPDHSRMERPHWHSGTGYVVYNSGLHFINGHEVTQECPLILPTDYLAEDWIVKHSYHSGVEALEALKAGKSIKHKDWANWHKLIPKKEFEDYVAIPSCDTALSYTHLILRELCENAWLIKDPI
jgi:hypothetical protein